jgi:glutamate-ammonia-ligase adenylyltransferase
MSFNSHPEQEKQWRQWCEALAQDDLAPPAGETFKSYLLRVWEASDYVAQACLREPRLLHGLEARGVLQRSYARGEMAQTLRAHLSAVADEAELGGRLRRFRRREMVRIIWRDITGQASLEETLEELSALADACIELALDYLYRWTAGEMGTPRDAAGAAQPLVVLGLGKLGARELNLSSDVDLIFAYPEPGRTDGALRATNEQFFLRLCQRLVQTLDNHTAEGFVFRVDVRLRPFGGAGPLAINFTAMESYYGSQAREWERYAMIKARVVAGEHKAGDELMAMLRPFVYRRYLDFGAIESLREMKQLISRELHKKGMDANIKLGQGGIREIEFIGQAFQLIRGGREKAL